MPKVAAARAPATPKANGTDGEVSAKRKRSDRTAMNDPTAVHVPVVSSATTNAAAPPPAGSGGVVASTKRKRPDRVVKLKKRKGARMTTVKSALRKYIRGDDELVTKIVEAVESRVVLASMRTVSMSLCMAGIVKDAFNGVQDVTEVNLDGIFEQTFARQLMVGTDGAVAPDGRITTYQDAHPQLKPTAERHYYDRNVYSAAAKTYQTNLKNALRVEVDDRVRVFCKRFGRLHNLTSMERMAMLYQLNGWKPPRKGFSRGVFPARRGVADAIVTHRHALGLDADTTISKKWLRSDDCLAPILRYNVLLNRFYEANDMRLFNIVPICKVKRHFISIDTHVLFGVLKDAGAIECDANVFDVMRDEQWRSVIDVVRLQGKDCTFNHSIKTDGISMCLPFERPNAIVEDEDGVDADDDDAGGSNKKKAGVGGYVADPGDVVFGNDPGRINIYYMATVLPDNNVKTYTLTRKQYYNDAGVFIARRHTECWNLGIKHHLDALSTVTSKGCDAQDHEAYLEVFHTHERALWDEYVRPRWARQRLSLYGGKKRVFARFFNKIKADFPGRNVVIAYGSAKFAPGGKGELSVPTTRAYKECATRVTTVSTDEFRTSKVYSVDNSILQLVAQKNMPRRSFRGVLWSVRRLWRRGSVAA
jgi:hypothetical protein